MNRILLFLSLTLTSLVLNAQLGFKTAIVEGNHRVIAFDISSDGKLLATVGVDNRILIRDIDTKELIREISAQDVSQAICFSDDGEYLAIGFSSGHIEIRAVSTGDIVRSYSGHSAAITALCFSTDRQTLVSASQDNMLRLWNVDSGEPLRNLSGSNGNISSVAINPMGTMVVAGADNGKLFIWDLSSGNLTKEIVAEEEAIKSVAFSPNGNFIAVAGNQSRISIWSAYGHSLENTMLGHIEAIEKISYSPDGRFIVSGGQDGFVIVFEITSGEIVYYTPKQSFPITSVVFSPSGKEILSASSQNDTIKVWDASSLGVKPKQVIKQEKQLERPKAKPEITWVTENNKESISLGYGVKYRVRSEYPLERINLNVNGERQVSESTIAWTEGQWIDFENIIYLKDGDNAIDAQLFYSDGMVTSEVLNIKYRQELAEELLRASRTRRVVVYLRESDEYEYKVSGAEGYLFHSEKINVEQAEAPSIDIELVPLKEDVAIILNNITFAYNSADLNSESFAELDRVVELLTTNPRITIEISAHTDDVGSLTYNMLLSDRRAQSVVNYLLENNVEPHRLVAKGYGPKIPMVPNDSDENRAFNRRVEFKIIEMKDKVTE